MMVIQARKTPAHVEMEEAAGEPRATNRLGVEMDFFVMRDAQGRYFAAEQVGKGQRAALAPIEWPDAAKRLKDALIAVSPVNPEGYDPREHNEALDFGSRNYSWMGGNVDAGLDEPDLNTSVLERALRRVIAPTPETLPRQSYVALTPHSPEVPLGIKHAQQMQSIHVIAGHW